MAYTLPNLVHQTHHYSKDRDNHHHLKLLNPPPPPPPPLLPNKPFYAAVSSPPPILTPATSTPPPQHDHRDDFFVNVGLAVRTLRHDLPLLFSQDLNYDIYRDDIVFVDPLNTFSGMEQYKLIFWALRFHGRMLFKDISVEILRVCQPSENLILIRWNLKGVPRVPWEATGEFQATSRYKLDRKGKIYEHKVDNLAFNFPQSFKPAASVLDLVAASCPTTTPTPTFFGAQSCSWMRFYEAVKDTLDRQTLSIPQQCFS